MGLEVGSEGVVASGESNRYAPDLTGFDTGAALAYPTQGGGSELRDVQCALNIGMKGSGGRSIPSVRLRIFALHRQPLCDTLAEVQRMLGPGFTPPPEGASVRIQQAARENRPGPADDELLKPLSVGFRNATLREDLHARVAGHGPAAWGVEECNGRLGLTVPTRAASTTGLLGSGRRGTSGRMRYLSGARPPGTNQPWALAVKVHG
jgi:hypothetical protein